MQNFKMWVAQSDIDFTTAFIKAWIPFNAWYNAQYPDRKDRDSDKIYKIINDTTNNHIKSHINYFMDTEDIIGIQFRSYLARFHKSLDVASLEFDGHKLSFNDVSGNNPDKEYCDNYRKCNYLAKRNKGGDIECHITLSTDVVFTYTHSEYDPTHLCSLKTFLDLSDERQRRIKACFDMINPIITFSALQQDKEKCDIKHNRKYSYNCDGIHFIKNDEDRNWQSKTVHKALIKLLYLSRNKLFHGELPPYEAVQPVYENAYFILKMILAKLK